MADRIEFPDSVDEFMERHKIVDSKRIYTNGMELVPIFRMKQWFEYVEPMQWIPCSERLPGDDEEVIVTIYDDSGDSAFSYTTVGWHFKGLWVVDNERCLKVVAWCELPEPYKAR